MLLLFILCLCARVYERVKLYIDTNNLCAGCLSVYERDEQIRRKLHYEFIFVFEREKIKRSAERINAILTRNIAIAKIDSTVKWLKSTARSFPCIYFVFFVVNATEFVYNWHKTSDMRTVLRSAFCVNPFLKITFKWRWTQKKYSHNHHNFFSPSHSFCLSSFCFLFFLWTFLSPFTSSEYNWNALVGIDVDKCGLRKTTPLLHYLQYNKF